MSGGSIYQPSSMGTYLRFLLTHFQNNNIQYNYMKDFSRKILWQGQYNINIKSKEKRDKTWDPTKQE